MYSVHKGQPPERKQRGKYPFETMAVDDWFIAPRDMGLTNDSQDMRRKSISSSAASWCVHNDPGRAFEVYLTADGDVCCRRVR